VPECIQFSFSAASLHRTAQFNLEGMGPLTRTNLTMRLKSRIMNWSYYYHFEGLEIIYLLERVERLSSQGRGKG